MTYQQTITLIIIPLIALDLFIAGWYINTRIKYNEAKSVPSPYLPTLVTLEEILTTQVILFFFVPTLIAIYIWLIPYLLSQATA